MGVEEPLTECIDAGSMAQVETENLEAMGPVGEVGLAGVAVCGVPGEARGDDQAGSRAEELQSGLISDFYAASGEKSDASVKIGGFGALDEVKVGARGA